MSSNWFQSFLSPSGVNSFNADYVKKFNIGYATNLKF